MEGDGWTLNFRGVEWAKCRKCFHSTWKGSRKRLGRVAGRMVGDDADADGRDDRSRVGKWE